MKTPKPTEQKPDVVSELREMANTLIQLTYKEEGILSVLRWNLLSAKYVYQTPIKETMNTFNLTKEQVEKETDRAFKMLIRYYKRRVETLNFSKGLKKKT